MSYQTKQRTNAFAAAAADVGGRIPGPKGAPVERTSDSSRVDWFNKINQDTSFDSCNRAVNDILGESRMNGLTDEERIEVIVDLFRLWAHKRGCHGNGEGNRDSSHYLLLAIYDKFPNTVVSIIQNRLFAEFGYWKDVRGIIKTIHKLDGSFNEHFKKYDPIVSALRTATLSQRTEDLKILDSWVQDNIGCMLSEVSNEGLRSRIHDIRDGKIDGKLPPLSLCGKYLVREKGADNAKCYWGVKTSEGISKIKHVSYMCRYLMKTRKNGVLVNYPATSTIPFAVYRAYRQKNALLDIASMVVETYMSSNRWDEIDMKYVPSVAKFTKRFAFLNELRKNPPSENSSEEETGNRHPDDPKRVSCRQHTLTHISEPSKIKTTGVLPHTIAYKARKATSSTDILFNQKFWDSKILEYHARLDSIRQKMVDEITADSTKSLSEKNAAVVRAIHSGNFIGVADISGSMTWHGKAPNRPYDVSCGLTAFMSEIASENFRDLAITFSADPHIYKFTKANGERMNLRERMDELRRYCGYNTDILKMNRAVCDLCVTRNVPEEDLPVIVIFSDEGWDQQTRMNENNYNTIHENIMSYWIKNGYRSIPTIVYWNLAGGDNPNKGMQTKATFPGVMFLQGTSPTLFDFILYGEGADTVENELIIEGKKINVKTSAVTPYMTFRKAMDNHRFFYPLLKVLDRSSEGLLSRFRMTEYMCDS